MLAKSLGFEVKHELFKVHSSYVRNALVLTSQGIYSKYEMIGDYKVNDYIEKPHEYVDNI